MGSTIVLFHFKIHILLVSKIETILVDTKMTLHEQVHLH